MDTLHRNEVDSCVPSTMTSFKKLNHYVKILIVAAHSAEDCCASKIKL